MYLWRIPDEFPEKFVGIYQRELSPDRFLFLNGNAVTANISTPRIEFDVPASRLASFDVLPNSSMIPLVSENVARLLLRYCANDIQLIDTQVIAKGQSLFGYKLVNAIRVVKCVDYDQSECVFMRNADQIMKFNRLRLCPNCMGTHHVAREADYDPYLYVSAQIKEAFDSNHWKGYQFSPPESVHP